MVILFDKLTEPQNKPKFVSQKLDEMLHFLMTSVKTPHVVTHHMMKILAVKILELKSPADNKQGQDSVTSRLGKLVGMFIEICSYQHGTLAFPSRRYQYEHLVLDAIRLRIAPWPLDVVRYALSREKLGIDNVQYGQFLSSMLSNAHFARDSKLMREFWKWKPDGYKTPKLER